MTMTDPITAASRAAAEQLAPEYGPGLAADVEAALYARETVRRSSQYIDPVSLATLIVAIATLAWTAYSDQRKKTPNPAPEIVARQVRIELRKHDDTSQHDTDRITEIIVTEIIQADRDPRS
jgi:uncharacterized membrane protein YebE (DUF533 family)